jgi:tetratricopeptide (TPR) repeat protein
VFAFATRNRLPLIVFSVAFLIRFVYLIAYSSSPFFQVHVADALYHEDWARRILGGDIFSLKIHGALYKAPLYPYFLALGYRLSGTSNFLPMLLQVIMAALSCLLLFLIGKRYFSASAACVGALIYNFYFPAVYFSTEMEIPTLAIFLTLLSFYLLVESPRAIALVGSAVVFGLSLLALPTNFLLLPLYVLVLLRKHGGMKQGRGKAMLFAAVVFATVFPCTLRNLIVDRRLTLISANGGINLFIGNNAKYDETVYLQPGYAFEELYDEPRRNAGADAFADRDRYWTKKAVGFMVEHPGQEALLVLKKLVLYLADYEIYRNTDTYYAKEVSIYKRIPFLPASLILATGLAGLLVALQRRKGLALVGLCVLQALPCLIFFVTDRYRLPSMALWALFSGFFVTLVVDAVRGRAWRSVVAPLAFAVCLAGVSKSNFFVVKNPAYRPHLNLGFIYETQANDGQALAEYAAALNLVKDSRTPDLKTEGELTCRLGNVQMIANDLDAAQKSFEQAIAINPSSGPAYSYLGTLYDKRRQSELGLQMFRRALAINPWDVVSLHNLGLLYLHDDRFDEAVATLKRAIALAPEDSAAHNDLAYIYGKQGKYDLMEAEAKSALDNAPENSAARYNLAALYLNTGRMEEAMAQYRAIGQTTPRDSSNAYNQLGIIYAEKGDLRQAIENWQKALAVDPSNERAQANLHQAQLMLR